MDGILIGGVSAVVIALGGYAYFERTEAQALRLELAQQRGALSTCAARLTNIIEARESNATIPDNLRDFDIPPGWFLPAE